MTDQAEPAGGPERTLTVMHAEVVTRSSVVQPRTGGWRVLFLAWMAFNTFALMGVEMLLLAPLEMSMYGTTELTTGQQVTHHLLTVAVWVVGGLALLLITGRVVHWRPFARQPRPSRRGWLVAGLAVLAVAAAMTVGWGALKPWKEWTELGPTLFASQYAYYLAEAFVIWCMVAFAQEAADRIAPRLHRVPWGGLVLALSWGLMHILSKADLATGLVAAATAAAYGVIFVAVKRDFRRSYPLILLAFLL